MKKVLSPEFILVAIMILAAAFSRLLTNYLHIWNFTPIIAMSLFSGAKIKDKRFAFIIPLSAMIITDAFLGFYQGILLVYFALVIITAFGFLLQRTKNLIYILPATLGASCIFFLVTNFALLYPTTLYPHTTLGVIASYLAAIPFFRNAIVGDLIYSTILFGCYQLFAAKIIAASRTMQASLKS